MYAKLLVYNIYYDFIKSHTRSISEIHCCKLTRRMDYLQIPSHDPPYFRRMGCL